MRNQLTLVLLLTLGSPCLSSTFGNGPAPNIVLILADDMACQDCGPYGSTQIRTPHLDRLASEGLTFRRAFTATAMCAPTRQQLYTGVFPVRNGAHPNHSRVKRGTRSMVHHLRDLGYRVGLLGKKHFGPPDSFPFELLTQVSAETFVTRDAQQPFCLVVTSNSPHLPWTEGPADYEPSSLKLPEWLVDTPETRTAYAAYFSEITAFDSEVGHWLEVLDRNRVADKTLFIATSEQGPQLPGGKWTCYDYGLKVALIARWPSVIDGGRQTDALVQYVDVVPTLIELAGGVPDTFDTGLAGGRDGGRGFDGRSFADVLTGKTNVHHEYVFGVQTTQGIIAGSPYPIRSVRDARYKYIRNLLPEAEFHNTVIEHDGAHYWRSWEQRASEDANAARLVQRYVKRPAEEFYDLRVDPHELNNLADAPEHRQEMLRLRSRLDEWMKQQGDLGVETELAVPAHRVKRRQKKKRRTPDVERASSPPETTRAAADS